MKRLKGYRGRPYDAPETADEQSFEYRGFQISWERPPVPPGSIGCEWMAIRDGYEEDGGFHSDTIDDLKEQIDDYVEALEESS